MFEVARTMRNIVSRLFHQFVMDRLRAELPKADDAETGQLISPTPESRPMPVTRARARSSLQLSDASTVTNKHSMGRRLQRLKHPVGVRLLGQSRTQVRIVL